MKKKLLFVHLPGPTYTQMADEIYNPNHDSYGLADGDEQSPTVSSRLQRSERKYEVFGAMSLPLGISYLSATLKDKFPNSLEQYLADYVEDQENVVNYKTVDDWILDLAKKKMPSKPDIIAISLMFSTAHKFFKHLVAIYRKLWPEAQIIIGGIHATNCAQYILDTTPEVDYLFKGEGEVAICKFVQNLIDNKPQDIQGVYKKQISSNVSKFNHEGKDINNKLCEVPDDLDQMPNHNYELFNYEKYFASAKLMKRYDDGDDQKDSKIFEIMGSRGCPFKCSFCSSHSSNDRNVRKRSIEHIMQQVRHMYDKNAINKILFNDDLFTMKKQRFFDMMKAFKESNIPNLQFFTQGFHINVTDEEMIDAVADMTDAILFAIDSGSQYIQDKIIHKKNKLSRGKELMAHAQKKGLIVRSNFIFGFPTETLEIMNESADYMRSVESDWFQIFTAIPFIGTSLHEQLLSRGVLKKRFDEKLWERSRYGEREFDTDTVTAKELTHYTYSLNLELNFINNFNLRIKRYERAAKMFKEVLVRYPTHVFGLISLYMAYEGLNDVKECAKIEKKIFEAISVDPSSRKMLTKHGNLLKDTKFYDIGSKIIAA